VFNPSKFHYKGKTPNKGIREEKREGLKSKQNITLQSAQWETLRGKNTKPKT
jgi:hypothetical protein